MAESSPNPQPQSPLFKLALETRLQIYTEFIKSSWTERIHIVPEHLTRFNVPAETPERFTYVPCTIPLEKRDEAGISRYGHASSCNIFSESRRKWSAPARENSNISLFLSCRQIYTEAFPLLYSTPILSLSNLTPTNKFLTSLPPTHLTSIQNLHVSCQPEQDSYLLNPSISIGDPHMTTSDLTQNHPSYIPAWTLLCSTLSTLPHLRSLHILLDHARIQEPELFKPLQSVTVKPNGVFILRIQTPKKFSTPRDSYPTIDTLSSSDLSRMGVEPAENGSKPFVFDGVVMPFRVDRRQWPDQDRGNWNNEGNERIDQPIMGGYRRRWKWRILCAPCFCVVFPFMLLHDYWKKRRATS